MIRGKQKIREKREHVVEEEGRKRRARRKKKIRRSGNEQYIKGYLSHMN